MKSKFFILVCKVKSGMIGFLAIDFAVAIEPTRGVMILALMRHGYSLADLDPDGPLLLMGYDSEEEANQAFDKVVQRFSN